MARLGRVHRPRGNDWPSARLSVHGGVPGVDDFLPRHCSHPRRRCDLCFDCYLGTRRDAPRRRLLGRGSPSTTPQSESQCNQLTRTRMNCRWLLGGRTRTLSAAIYVAPRNGNPGIRISSLHSCRLAAPEFYGTAVAALNCICGIAAIDGNSDQVEKGALAFFAFRHSRSSTSFPWRDSTASSIRSSAARDSCFVGFGCCRIGVLSVLLEFKLGRSESSLSSFFRG